MGLKIITLWLAYSSSTQRRKDWRITSIWFFKRQKISIDGQKQPGMKHNSCRDIWSLGAEIKPEVKTEKPTKSTTANYRFSNKFVLFKEIRRLAQIAQALRISTERHVIVRLCGHLPVNVYHVTFFTGGSVSPVVNPAPATLKRLARSTLGTSEAHEKRTKTRCA